MAESHPSHRPLDTDLASAPSVLARYELDRRSCVIDQPTSGSGFSGALVLRVLTGQHSYALRRWPSGGLSRQRLLQLHQFLRHLGASGIDQIPVPVNDTTGQSLIEINGRLWQLEPWQPGTADFHRHPTPQRLRSAMQTLARVHLAAESYTCPPAGRVWFDKHSSAPSPACRERLELLRGWTPSRQSNALAQLSRSSETGFATVARQIIELFAAASGSVERELLSFHNVAFRLHPCLRDVWHDHLLFTGDELTGLIDPAATRTENVAADLSRLLGSFIGDDSQQRNLGLSLYSEIRPLSNDELRLIAALDHSGVLLSGMTWIDRSINGRLADNELPHVIPRVEAIRERLTHFAGTLCE